MGNRERLTLYALLIVGTGHFSKAQTTPVYERYASTWATGEDHKFDNKQVSTNYLPTVLKAKIGEIELLIPQTNAFVERENGNAYIKLYLVNKTTKALSVPRQDATVGGITSEVYVDGKWKLLQAKIGASCGNSYWTMSLKSNHYIYLEIENPIRKGSQQVPYRVRFKTATHDVVSNSIDITITPELLALAGTKIPSISD
jgi:hypothetical protein